MKGLLMLLALVAVWALINRWLLPKMGIEG